MRYDLRHLQAFLAVADTLHFGRAAEKLHISQPALSRTIRQLESTLGVKLLERNSRNVALSAAGRTFAAEAHRVMTQLENGEHVTRMSADGRAGRLVIGYIDFAFGGSLPAELQRFRQANPTIAIELVRMATDMQKVALAGGEGIDIGYVLGRFSAPDVECALAERQKNVALLPSEHPLARRPVIEIADLLREPLVVGTAHDWSAFRRLVFDNALRIGIRPQIVQEAPSSEVIFALVAAGIGVSIYGQSDTELVRSGVTVRPLAGMKGDTNIYAAWNGRQLSPVAERFVREVIKRESMQDPQNRSVRRSVSIAADLKRRKAGRRPAATKPKGALRLQTRNQAITSSKIRCRRS